MEIGRLLSIMKEKLLNLFSFMERTNLFDKFKICCKTLCVLLLFVILLGCIKAPLCLKYNYKLKAYTNCFGFPVITKVYDATRHIDNYDSPYLLLYEGEAFYEGRATVWVVPQGSDYITAACINTVGDIIDVTNCKPTKYDDEIVRQIPNF